MLEIVLLIVGCAIAIVGCLVMITRIERKNSETYDWQPDTSHKAIFTEFEGPRGPNDTRVQLIKKTQEELREEKRAYLKDRKNYD
jgi:hypothetical protein